METLDIHTTEGAEAWGDIAGRRRTFMGRADAELEHVVMDGARRFAAARRAHSAEFHLMRRSRT
ncbi:hypothetical protein [Polyangium mundeleinium]|uniref:Uncharacterized protein n=1 Tax=Polyangium mundeleinium TaxID=2995306 RepID=A0ABT5FAB5_9BACT|nr:hypothetical protein [Polyangium mundeleinium]MDC0750055.1 hypothetical protein [Polyangium mundeleinium]